jgi:hypothetical protein
VRDAATLHRTSRLPSRLAQAIAIDAKMRCLNREPPVTDLASRQAENGPQPILYATTSALQHGWRSAWSARRCVRAAPARPACPLPIQADASRKSAATCGNFPASQSGLAASRAAYFRRPAQAECASPSGRAQNNIRKTEGYTMRRGRRVDRSRSTIRG